MTDLLDVTPLQCGALIKKLAEVMGEIERVAKNGRNDFHQYDYATESDITAAVRKGMADRGLMLIPDVRTLTWRQTEKGTPIATLMVQFTITDGEQALPFTMIGEGQDSGDKATYKALTGAVKYALSKLFLIPTGDDPERNADGPPTKPARTTARPTRGATETRSSSHDGPLPVAPSREHAPVSHEPEALPSSIFDFGDVVAVISTPPPPPRPTQICPRCGKPAIIKGRKEWGGGWVCYKKKDGCGAKWPDGAAEIEQPGADLSDPETHRRESEIMLPLPGLAKDYIDRITAHTEARVMSFRHKFDLGDEGYTGLDKLTINELEMLARHLELT